MDKDAYANIEPLAAPIDPLAPAQLDQPWLHQTIAELYDLFPFDADVPLYLDLAGAEGGHVLEAACGTGRLVLPLAEAGCTVASVDASPHMLAIARRKLDDAGPPGLAHARLVLGDMRDFDLGDRFDLAIVATKTFGYLLRPSEQMAALHTVRRHLRPHGLLALDLLHPTGAWLHRPVGEPSRDLLRRVPERGLVVSRVERVLHDDPTAQLRVVRSDYELVWDDGKVERRSTVWPFRYTFPLEVERLLHRAGFDLEGMYGGYDGEPLEAGSNVLLALARRRER